MSQSYSNVRRESRKFKGDIIGGARGGRENIAQVLRLQALQIDTCGKKVGLDGNVLRFVPVPDGRRAGAARFVAVEVGPRRDGGERPGEDRVG